MSTPKKWPDMVLSTWPDVLEVYKDEEGIEEYFFIVNRKNARSFTMEQAAMLSTLERMGLNVRVRFGLVDMSLQEFEQGGAYKGGVFNRQVGYNLRSEAKHLQGIIAKLAEDDRRIPMLRDRLQRLQFKLGELEVPNSYLTKESDETLDKIVEVFRLEDDPKIRAAAKLKMENDIEEQKREITQLNEVIPYMKGDVLLGNQKMLRDKQDWLQQLETRYIKQFGGQQ